MKVIFKYEKEKDIWCLLNKGAASNNSSKATVVYTEMLEKYGENINQENTSKFIDYYLNKNNINIEEKVIAFQKEWENICQKYIEIAEKVFKTKLPENVSAYLTINNRCPYNIKENFFFLSISNQNYLKTIMHELWHFYTWYGIGEKEEEKMGFEKYNTLKESLTILLNVECKELLPEGLLDLGYPQHQEIRKEILSFWEKEKDIHKLWEYLKSKV